MEFWVNRQDSPAPSSVLLVDGATALKLEQYPNTRNVGFTESGVADYAFDYIAPAGTWVHLAFVVGPTNTTLYANGAMQGVIGASIALPLAALGTDGRGDRLKGLVDELSVYRRELSAAEIQAIYAAGAAGKCPPSPYQPGSCLPAPSGLVDWWPGSDTANDLIGTNQGTLLNGTAFTAGEVGTAFDFDGVDDLVMFGGTPLPPPWTAECWVKREDSASFSSVLLADGATALKLEHYPNTRKVGFTQFGVADYNFSYSAPVGTWVHLAFVGTAGSTALHVNGVLQDSIAASIVLPRAQLGSDIHGDHLKGAVDEFSVYDRALSASEIYALYAAGSAGKCLAPVYIKNVSPSGGSVRLEWLAQPGAVYRVQFKADLAQPTWTDLPGDVTAKGATATSTDVLPSGAPQRFYRIEMLQ